MTIKEFPPSVNSLYFSLHGKKAMSTEGRKFQRRLLFQITQEHGAQLAGFDANTPYSVELTIYFPEIYNQTWPEKAKQKYKRRDATNLIKLLEDTLAKGIGVDDANFLKFSVEKKRDPDNPRIEVRITDY